MKNQNLKNLMYKELRLSIHPMSYVTLLFVTMLIIPNYPYYIAFSFVPLTMFFTFMSGRENNDLAFTCSLPVQKRDVVKVRFCVYILQQIIQVILSIPIALLSIKINPNGENIAGIEPNFAFFGLVFIMYALYNIAFLPNVYKNMRKLGVYFWVSYIVMFVYIIAIEIIFAHIPGKLSDTMDSVDPANFPSQCIVLLIGIIVYIIVTFAAYKKSVRNFEAVDL